MSYIKPLLLATIALCFYACSSPNTASNLSQSGSSKEALIKALNTFNEAFQKGDIKILESMITENYVHTNGNAKSINKRTWLNYLRKREQEINSGELEVLNYQMLEMEIVLHGNVAIVTGKVAVTNKRGEEIQENAYRITNIWVNENGTWKRAGFHDGKI